MTEPQAVAFVHFPAGKFRLDFRQNVGHLLVAQFELFLGHGVRRIFGNELFGATVMVRHPAEHEGGSDQGIAAVMERRENHAAVAFATDNATLFDHLQAHVDFADFSTAKFATVLFGHILVHAACRQINTNTALLLAEHFFSRNGERIFFTDTLAKAIDESATVRIGVNSKAHCATVILYRLAEVTQVFGNGFGATGEGAIGFAMYSYDITTKLFQQTRNNVRPSAIHGIYGHLKVLGLDSFHIHKRNLQGAIHMHAVGILHELVLAHVAVVGIIKIISIGEFKQLLYIGRTKEQALVIQELEGVPFQRIVACRNDNAGIGLQFGGEDFHRGRRGKAHFYDIYARETANARHELANGITGRTAVATDHHALCACNLQKGAYMAL